MDTLSSILAWGIPWTEEHGRLQSIGLQRVGHDWSNLACMHAPCHLRLMLVSWNCNLKNPCFSFSAMNWMITTERVSYGAAVSEPTYDMLEMQDLRRALDLLIENQRFNKISRCFLYILKSEKTWSRESHLRSSLIAALSNCYLGRISAFHEQRANQLSRLGLVPAITITSYSDPPIIWHCWEMVVSSGKVNILLRAMPVGTTGYYFRTKGKMWRETFLEHIFFSFSKYHE